MTATYDCIATTTPSSTTTTVTLSTIPGTYTDLVLVINGRIAGNIYYRLNSDSGSNYSQANINGDGSSAASNRETSVTGTYIGDFIGAPMDNDSATAILNFQNYSNTTTYKTSLFRLSNASKAATASVGLWRNTSAITSISVTSSTTNGIYAGCMFTLYGIKAE